jgi:hypothetical protein
MAARLAAALLAGALLAGCDAFTPSEAASTPDPLAPAPAAVRNRVALPGCGSEGQVPNVAARQCFWKAYAAGLTAEFITSRRTPSGAPTMAVYRALGPGRAQLFGDFSDPALGGRGWVEVDCPGFTMTRDGEFFPDFVPGVPGQPECTETLLGGGR